MHPKESLFQPLLSGTDCPVKFNASGAFSMFGMLLCLILWPAAGMTQIFGVVLFQTQVISGGSELPETNAVKSEDSNLGVYPNPASEVLSIHLNDASVIDACSLRDGVGTIIYHETYEIPVHVAQLNLKATPVGEYILQVHSGKRLFSKQIVKQ